MQRVKRVKRSKITVPIHKEYVVEGELRRIDISKLDKDIRQKLEDALVAREAFYYTVYRGPEHLRVHYRSDYGEYRLWWDDKYQEWKISK